MSTANLSRQCLQPQHRDLVIEAATLDDLYRCAELFGVGAVACQLARQSGIASLKFYDGRIAVSVSHRDGCDWYVVLTNCLHGVLGPFTNLPDAKSAPCALCDDLDAAALRGKRLLGALHALSVAHGHGYNAIETNSGVGR